MKRLAMIAIACIALASCSSIEKKSLALIQADINATDVTICAVDTAYVSPFYDEHCLMLGLFMEAEDASYKRYMEDSQIAINEMRRYVGDAVFGVSARYAAAYDKATEALDKAGKCEIQKYTYMKEIQETADAMPQRQQNGWLIKCVTPSATDTLQYIVTMKADSIIYRYNPAGEYDYIQKARVLEAIMMDPKKIDEYLAEHQ